MHTSGIFHCGGFGVRFVRYRWLPIPVDYSTAGGIAPRRFIGSGRSLFLSASAELSHSLKVSDRRRTTPKSGQNRSESLCAGLWAPCRVFWAWFGFALGPVSVRNIRFPAGSLQTLWGPFSLSESSSPGGFWWRSLQLLSQEHSWPLTAFLQILTYVTQ